MDKWVEEFQKKNGRKPTFAEFQAHNAEQKSAATGAKPVQQSAESVKPAESAAPQQTQAGQPSASAQAEKPAKSGQQAQSAQSPTSGQANQPAQAEEPTQADKPAQGNRTVQPTQSAKANQSANMNQTVQPTQSAKANQSANMNQTVQPTQSAKANQSANTNQTVQPTQSAKANQSANMNQTVQPTQSAKANQSANMNQTVQPTQSAKANQSANMNQTVQPTQSAKANQSANMNQTVQPKQPAQNAANTQPAQNAANTQPTQNVANTQQKQNTPVAPQMQPVNETAKAQSGPQANNNGGPQQQAAPQNAAMAQQDFAQTTQPTAPKKSSKSGSKVKHFFFSPLGIGAIAVVILLIAFVTTGLVTSTSRDSLRKKYNEAVANDNPKALLELFPKDQTESRFADVGAKSLIRSKLSFDKIETASSDDNFSLVEKKHLLFFKSYSLNASTTVIAKGDAPKGGKLTIDGKEVTDKDFKTAFFPGTYKIKAEVKNEFGESEYTTKFVAGKKKAVSLEFSIDDRYVTLPAGPDSINVKYKGEDTGIKLSDKEQKVGPIAKDEDDEDDRAPSDDITLSGEYGDIKINEADFGYMDESSLKLRLENKEMLPIYKEEVSFDKKKLDAYITPFAKDWFKAGQTGSTEGLSTLDGLLDSNQLPDTFKNEGSKKLAYKGIEMDKYTPYRFYIGLDGKLYVAAEFYLLYTSTDTDQKGAKPVDRKSPQWILFRIEEDGKMKAVADAYKLKYSR